MTTNQTMPFNSAYVGFNLIRLKPAKTRPKWRVFLHKIMDNLHYLVMDKTTTKLLAVIIVPLDKYDFVYKFDAEKYTLRGLTPDECRTYIDLDIAQADVTEFYTRS